MAYSNTNCTPCQTSIPSTCIEGPPACSTNQCAEIYPGQCVTYTGPAIPCFGITPNMSLDEVIQIMAEHLCGEQCCTNPIEWYMQYAIDIFNIESAKEGVSPNIVDILDELLTEGMIQSNCNFCCPDGDGYLLANGLTIDLIIANLSTGEVNPAINSLTDFEECLEALNIINPNIEPLFTTVPSVADAAKEVGSIQSGSVLCLIYKLFAADFSATIVYDIIVALIARGIAVECNGPVQYTYSIADFMDNHNVEE